MSEILGILFSEHENLMFVLVVEQIIFNNTNLMMLKY